MVLKVQTKSIFGQVLFEIFFIDNCAWHAFQVFDFLPVIVFLKADVIERLDFPLGEPVFERVGVFSKEGGLRIKRALLVCKRVHLCEDRGFFVECCSRQGTN